MYVLIVNLTGVYFGVVNLFRFEYETVKLGKIFSIKISNSNFVCIHYNFSSSISIPPMKYRHFLENIFLGKTTSTYRLPDVRKIQTL